VPDCEWLERAAGVRAWTADRRQCRRAPVARDPREARAIDPFVIVDAAMNDLMRPALYDAWHRIEAVRPGGSRRTANVVGPVCETGDTFATGRRMDEVAAGDLVVFRTAGAYAAAMSSTYNSRPLTPEVLVDGDRWAVVRPRLDIEALIAADRVPDWLGGCVGPPSS
jgi:diaminopimelate decarboxylase